MWLFLVLLIVFSAPEIFGQNDISYDLLNRPVCIKARGNPHGEEFLYTSNLFKEGDILDETKSIFFDALLLPGLIAKNPVMWLAKKYYGINDVLNPKYVFFTPPLNKNKQHKLDNDYKEHKWQIKRMSQFGTNLYEIENIATKQVLLLKGESDRYANPDKYIYDKMRFVFVENFDGHQHNEHSSLWKISQAVNGSYIIKNAWSNEYLIRSKLGLRSIPAVATVDQTVAGTVAATWVDGKLILEGFLTIEKC